MAMAYLLGLCAALCAATGAAVQHREVAEVPTASSTGLRLVIAALRRPLYLLGFAVLLGAFAFQFAALRVGDLTQVQPMLATELLFLMVIIVFTHHQRPGRREWAAAVMIVGGLALFLVAAKPHGGALRCRGRCLRLVASQDARRVGRYEDGGCLFG